LVLLALVLCAFVSAQTGLPSSAKLLHSKEKRFDEYQEDFLSFAKSAMGVGGSEYEAGFDFYTIAAETGERLHAARTLLEIYDDLLCEEDRARIRFRINSELLYYGKEIDLSIQQVNVYIPATKRPGVAAEAIRMKDDLREVKGILDSVKLQ